MSVPPRSLTRFVEPTSVAIGLVALACITLIYPATTRMHATPWNVAYAVTLAIPLIGFAWHVATNRTWQPPPRSWTWALVALAASVLLSALASPYCPIILRWSAPTLSAVALFFWVHAARAPQSPSLRANIANGLAFATVILAVLSFGWWISLVMSVVAKSGPTALIWESRNGYPLGHSNYTAGAMLLGLPWITRFAVTATTRRQHFVWVAAALLGLFVLFTTGSRGGLIGLAVLTRAGISSLRLSRRRLLIATGVAVGACVLLAFSNPRVRRLLAPSDGSTPPSQSSIQRFAMIEGGIAMIADRPLLGWGLHATPLVYPRFRTYVDGGAENVLQLHNSVLEWWAGLGTLGLIPLGALVVLAARNRRRESTATITLIAYAVFALTDYQLDVPYFLAAVVLNLLLLSPPSRPQTKPLPNGARWSIAALPLLLGLSLLTFGQVDPAPPLAVRGLQVATEPNGEARAIALLRDSLAANPDQEIAHFNLGWLLVVDNPAAAERHFRRAAQLVPDKGGVYFGLGLARLNQGDANHAADYFALECINDPTFIASPWWQVPGISVCRSSAQNAFARDLAYLRGWQLLSGPWTQRQIAQLSTLTDRLGAPPFGPERTYRRTRPGYAVLMRNLDLPLATDLYDVREDSSFAPSLDFPLPPKGWLPTSALKEMLEPTVTLPET